MARDVRVRCCASMLATVLVAILSFSGNAATTVASSALRLDLKSSAEADDRTNMSVDKAFDILRQGNRTSSGFVSFIQEHIHRAHSQSGRRASAKLHLRKSDSQALEMLNTEIWTIASKRDVEKLSCETFNREKTARIEEIRVDIAMFDSMVSQAEATLLGSQAQIDMYEKTLPGASTELTNVGGQCHHESTALQKEAEVLEKDLKVMEEILSFSTCETSFLQLGRKSHHKRGTHRAHLKTSLLHCKAPDSGKSFIQLSPDDPTLQKAMAKLRHPKVQQLLREQGIQFEQSGLSFVQRHRRKRLHVGKRRNGEPFNDGNSFFIPPPMSDFMPKVGDHPVVIDDAPQSDCTFAGNPKCELLRERFMNIAGGIQDMALEVGHMMHSLEVHCDQVKSTLQEQIDTYQISLKREGAKLAEIMSERRYLSTQSGLKRQEQGEANKEHGERMQECVMELQTLKQEKCGLEKIRGELMQLSSITKEVEDCKVSDWAVGECSVSCGGGKHTLERSVQVYPMNGAKCPALTAVQSCNEKRCPLACHVEEWGRWGSCSVLCGGGVMERIRHITAGSAGCAETSQTQTCNVQGCDLDCQLDDWSAWSASCSKVCDGGRQIRVRSLETAAVGNGHCDDFHDPKRYESKTCNTQTCHSLTHNPMKCVAKLDVILLLDGSSSLGADGFNALKGAAGEIAKSMNAPADVHLASALFSGPETFPDLKKCMGMNSSDGVAPDLEKQCGFKWLHKFQEDKSGDEVAATFAGEAYPEKTALMAMAVSLAEAELQYGRADAQSVVILLSDGVSISKETTARAVAELSEKARLMWIVANPHIDMDTLRLYVPPPWSDNLVLVKNVEDLSGTDVMNHIIADACPKITMT